MAIALLGRHLKHGIALEATSVGTESAPTKGLVNFNKAVIIPGQQWDDAQRQNGYTCRSTTEYRDGRVAPTFSVESAMMTPAAAEPQFMAYLGALTGHDGVTQTGAGPFIQTIISRDTNTGYSVSYGDTITAGDPISFCIKESAGAGAGEDSFIAGCVPNRIDLTFPSDGFVRMTVGFMSLLYNDSDTIDGTTTLPAASLQLRSQDFKYKYGDGTPAALYSEELTLSFIADMIPKYYGGWNDAYPFKLLFNGWSTEGTFKKPWVSGASSMAKEHWFGGGDSGNHFPLYIYNTTDYSDNPDANGELWIKVNVRVKEDPGKELDNETTESVSFEGVYDSTTSQKLWTVLQGTTSSQTWAV